MRKWLVLVVACLWLAAWSTRCEASMLSQGVSTVWTYLFAPVNCVAQYGTEIVASTLHFVQCVINNANLGRIIP